MCHGSNLLDNAKSRRGGIPLVGEGSLKNHAVFHRTWGPPGDGFSMKYYLRFSTPPESYRRLGGTPRRPSTRPNGETTPRGAAGSG